MRGQHGQNHGGSDARNLTTRAISLMAVRAAWMLVYTERMVDIAGILHRSSRGRENPFHFHH